MNHVRALGMGGIWVEPEMINPDSDLFRAHQTGCWPYRVITSPPAAISTRWICRIRLFLPYLLERLDDLLSRYDIGYLKWDMNREIVQPSLGSKAAITGQTQAVYRLFDEIRTRHPLVRN